MNINLLFWLTIRRQYAESTFQGEEAGPVTGRLMEKDQDGGPA
jgi:hypothetical protein